MTVPVADARKVRRRQLEKAARIGHDKNKNNIADASLLEQSYVFDYQEDQRARAADVVATSSWNGDPTRRKSDFSASNRTNSARQKKRLLEGQYYFGSSAPSLNSPNGRRQSSQSPTRTRPTTVFPSHHSVPSLLPTTTTQPRENNENTHKIPSKAAVAAAGAGSAGASLNGYLVANNTKMGGAKRKSSRGSRDGSTIHNSGSTVDTNASPRRKIVQMRNTDRLLIHERQGSGLTRQNSFTSSSNATTTTNTDLRGRSPSRQKREPSMIMERGNSATRIGGGSLVAATVASNHTSMSRTNHLTFSGGSSTASHQKPPITRQGSKNKSMGPRSRSFSTDCSTTAGTTNPLQQPPLTRGQSQRRRRSQSFDRSSSRISITPDCSNSIVSVMKYSNQPTIIQQGDKTIVLVPVTEEQARQMPKTETVHRGRFRSITTKDGKPVPFYFPRKIIPPVEETPPRSLVLIWVLISAELAFDLATTIIAFLALVEDDTCCGEQIALGPIPMTVTTPFFLLVLAELTFLFRAVILTLWPSILTGDITEEDQAIRDARGIWKKYLCCFLRWKAKFILQILNFLVLINPFFGCIIAWMLLYQSNKISCFVVLGLEACSILLHFCSVYLEGSCKTWSQIFCHCIPLVPFFASVALILFYLKQGGVCYLVNSELFMFTGCELCDDGLPPQNNQCLINGTNVTFSSSGIFDFEDVNGVDGVTSAFTQRVDQGEYCGNLQDEGPDDTFCFFKY